MSRSGEGARGGGTANIRDEPSSAGVDVIFFLSPPPRRAKRWEAKTNEDWVTHHGRRTRLERSVQSLYLEVWLTATENAPGTSPIRGVRAVSSLRNIFVAIKARTSARAGLLEFDPHPFPCRALFR